MSGGAPRDYGLADTGSPVYAASIGTEDVERTARFYQDALGLDVLDRRRVASAAFNRHWGLPEGVATQVAIVGEARHPVGRIALLQFDVPGRRRVRTIPNANCYGFMNLNFYAEDIFAQTRRLEGFGCEAWSAPQVHDMGEMGQPIEVMLEGPDGIIINLIQLCGDRPDARVLRTKAWIEDHGGWNRCGGTPVVTSAHHLRDHARGMAFYTEVLGMSVRNDVVLSGRNMETFTRYPPGARARDTYVQGNHVYGKVAVMQPLNFECVDFVPDAVAPNIGYLAQSFIVDDLGDTLRRAASVGAATFSGPEEIDMPGLGAVRAAIVRNPGSGALHELIQRR